MASAPHPSPAGNGAGRARSGRRMRAAIHDRYGIDALEVREVEVPELEPNHVLVRVHASSVNPAEWYRVHGPLFVRGANGVRKPKRGRVGADLAGVVEAVGSDVADLRPGDEVFGTSGGSWAEYTVAREPRLARKPANVSFEDAAAVPIAGLTALQALRDHAKVQAGEKVLVNGASGGVGTYAVQLAKAFGAGVTAVCSTRNVDLVRSLGADRVVDYTREDFTQLAERHDVLVDIAGSRSFLGVRKALTRDARVVSVGAPMSAKGLGPLPHIVATRLKAIGRSQSVTFFVAKIEKDDLEVMASLLADGKVRSVIDRRYDLGQIREALDYLGTRHARGKVVITV